MADVKLKKGRSFTILANVGARIINDYTFDMDDAIGMSILGSIACLNLGVDCGD
jgi:hypothetical protein